MNCACGCKLEEAVYLIRGRWHGYLRCRPCDPSGKWTAVGPVDVIWPPLVPLPETVASSEDGETPHHARSADR